MVAKAHKIGICLTTRFLTPKWWKHGPKMDQNSMDNLWKFDWKLSGRLKMVGRRLREAFGRHFDCSWEASKRSQIPFWSSGPEKLYLAIGPGTPRKENKFRGYAGIPPTPPPAAAATANPRKIKNSIFRNFKISKFEKFEILNFRNFRFFEFLILVFCRKSVFFEGFRQNG